MYCYHVFKHYPNLLYMYLPRSYFTDMNCIVQCSYFTDIYIVQGLNIRNKIRKINYILYTQHLYIWNRHCYWWNNRWSNHSYGDRQGRYKFNYLGYVSFLRIVVSSTYCVVFLFCLTWLCVPYVTSFSRLSILDCHFAFL